MTYSGKPSSLDRMIRGLASGGLCESKNVCLLLFLLTLVIFAASVYDFITPLLSEFVSEDEVWFRPASTKCTSPRIYLWDIQEMILRDIEEGGTSVF